MQPFSYNDFYVPLRSKKAGNIIIGIDPAKGKHQAAAVDAHGNQRGSSFSFPVSSVGYSDVLWRNVAKILPNGNARNVVFAVETQASSDWTETNTGRHERPPVTLGVKRSRTTTP